MMNMTSDIDLFGVYIPPLVFAAVAALAVLFILRRGLDHVRFYQLIALRDVFDLALYFVILAALLYLFGGPTLTPLFGALQDAQWRPATTT
ncbi:hypothetical protein LMG27952_05652 [Paraburkholderia hiiakae]|uniref:DUF1656 domain-containing protein n=1 Tax=Paraburkholderia hiiakae TaxID=1081782 RepID=A0ABM8P2S4_9BURK|nr:DUF1656 domain-containing protein [Paraburkholderia hiiakae]CAD6554658.1 hypothetical protein LMG27952_05652 [Paraburkholderia hiiakae]